MKQRQGSTICNNKSNKPCSNPNHEHKLLTFFKCKTCSHIFQSKEEFFRHDQLLHKTQNQRITRRARTRSQSLQPKSPTAQPKKNCQLKLPGPESIRPLTSSTPITPHLALRPLSLPTSPLTAPRVKRGSSASTEVISDADTLLISSAENSPASTPANEIFQLLAESRNATVKLKRSEINEIFVTKSSPGFREICYTGVETNDGLDISETSTLREWRLQTVPTVPKMEIQCIANCDDNGDDNENDDDRATLVMEIPVDYPYLFNVNGIQDDLHSILDVLAGDKMSSLVLDAYLTRMIKTWRTESSVVEENSQLEFNYLSVHFFPVHERDQCPTTFRPGMKYFPKFELHRNLILIAPLYTCKHFYLAVIDFSKREVRVYDSSWHWVSMNLRFFQVKDLLKWLSTGNVQDGLFKEEWKITFQQTCPQQMDEYSCGAYGVRFVENEVKGRIKENFKHITKEEVVKIRGEIVSQLLSTNTNGIRLLRAISE